MRRTPLLEAIIPLAGHIRRSRAAISFIEVTIVILIIGLLAAVSVPRFAEAARITQLQAASQTLAEHARYLQATAINEGRSISLVFDADRDRYYSTDADMPEQPGRPLEVRLASQYDATFQLSANFDSTATVTFDFEGVPRVGSKPLGRGEAILASGKHRFAVGIETGTGRVSVTRLAAQSDSIVSSETPSEASGESL